MGITKTAEFTKTQNDLAAMAKALGHPARIAILQFLVSQSSCVCGDIVDELPLSQSTVSQHLKELKKVGLIKGNIDGPTVCYCIDLAAWNATRKKLNEFFDSYTNPKYC